MDKARPTQEVIALIGSGMASDPRAQLQQKVMTQLLQGDALDSVTWPIERLWELRDERLRALIAHAKSKSSWHKKRLKDVHPREVNAQNLYELPVMTKADLMENWDGICTIRGLTLDKARKHLADLASRKAEIDFAHPLIMSTSGSSGNPTIVAWDLEAWSQMAVEVARYGYWLSQQNSPNESAATKPETQPAKLEQATLTSTSDVSMSRQMAATFANDTIVNHAVRANFPAIEIMERLAQIKPLMGVFGYASVVTAAATAASKRGVEIRPSMIGASSEPFTPAMSAFVKEIFGVEPSNTYAVTEISALAARTFPGFPDLILAEDIAVYEPIRYTKAGKVRTAKATEFSEAVLVTNVLNHAIPLIRYELMDQVRISEANPEIPWTGRRIEIGAVVPKPFGYGDGTTLNPVGIGYILDEIVRIVDYSVRQTSNGIEISYWSYDDVDAIELHLIEDDLRAKVPDLQELSIQFNPVFSVDALPRTPAGKRRRYVPLAG